jgi:hypothetical protein
MSDQKNCFSCKKTKSAGQKLFAVFGLATFFQFKSETVFRLKIHKDPKSHTFPLFGALKPTLLFKLGPKLQFCQTAKFKNG